MADELAKILWDYHHVNHQLKKADLLFILCSHDLSVAHYGAKLFLDGWAPVLAISGGVAHQTDLLNTGWQKSEAEMFFDVAIEAGISREEIILETKAKNTGDNFELTEVLLKERGLNPKVTEYPLHAHKGSVSIYILNGGVFGDHGQINGLTKKFGLWE